MRRNQNTEKPKKGIFTLIILSLGWMMALPQAFAQFAPVEKALVNDFNQYRSQYIQEKIYIHTDKDAYLAGEICWFRIYYLDAFYHTPAIISKIGYVEILDRNNRPVLQEKVSLKPGESNGSLVIPVNLASGVYTFRAYTNWMKNFGPAYFFEKAIRIINPENLQPDSTITKIKKFDIQFFPEGGNLVQQIETKVAFRITDAYGRGLMCEGLLLNSAGDTVLKFHPLHKGLGSFIFTPAAGSSYKAIIRFPQGESLIKELPASYQEGYVMNLFKNGDGKVVVSVKGSANLEGQDILLIIHGQHSILPVKTGRLSAGANSFLLETGELEDGISQFTLFSKTGDPVCERLYFKYPEHNLLISAETSSEYQTRKKINLELSATQNGGKAVAADMSLAVYRIDSLQNIDPANIRNYLYLTAEIGSFESPDFYFEENGKSRETDMENLMLTHGWRRFNWKEMVKKSPIQIGYAPEFNGHIILGKIVNNISGTVLPLTQAYLSIPSSRTQFRTTMSDSGGRVKFEMTGFYGSEEMIVQTNTAKDSMAHIEIDNPFSEKYSGSVLPDFFIPLKNSTTLQDQYIHEQVQHVFYGARLNQSVLQWVDSNPFYVVPDEKYMVDDFTRFQTMEEVIREYVHSVSVTLHKNNFKIYAYDKPNQRFFPDDPLILIDGVPFFSANELMRQDPIKIKRIDLVNREYALGYRTFYGIINLTTFKGNLEGIELNPHINVLDYPAIAPERQFFAPQYETETQINSRMPDYRTLLYWTPQIKSGEQGKKQLSFYTSDLPGKYVIMVQGLSENGEPGSLVQYFNVKK